MASVAFWDTRFHRDTYVFGVDPHPFLQAHLNLLPRGSQILSLGEGEGRNATFLAERGFHVAALDSSRAALAKLERLATQKRVRVQPWFADASREDLGRARWDVIINIYCHLPSHQRPAFYRRIDRALKPGGIFMAVLLAPDTPWGHRPPRDQQDLLVPLSELTRAFQTYRPLVADQVRSQLEEGFFGQRNALLTRFIARK
jgi:SAM-dependent methyltransferase